jgi:hypothetical protein
VIFDSLARVRDCRAVSAERTTYCAVIQAQHNVREIHRHLAGKRGRRTAA